MKIIPLRKNERVYSCYSYLILGDWNRVDDLNTLIDPGTDDFVLEEIARHSTGLGKEAVEQIILTHNHFDHSAAIRFVKERFKARVYAFTKGPDVDELLHDGQILKAGDGFLEVIHTPGHSSDSICLYAPEARALFSGDTQLKVRSAGDVYSRKFLDGLLKISGRKINVIYSGHDAPFTTNVKETLLQTLSHVRNSSIAPFSSDNRVAV